MLGVAKALGPALNKMNELLALIRPALIAGLESFVLALEVGIKVVDRLREALHNLLVGLNVVSKVLTLGLAQLFTDDFVGSRRSTPRQRSRATSWRKPRGRSSPSRSASRR